jgi:hypothetical protein
VFGAGDFWRVGRAFAARRPKREDITPGSGRFWNSSSFPHDARATRADRSPEGKGVGFEGPGVARSPRRRGAISPRYLNDIEHDRRSPSSDRMVQQFADALGIDRDWLYYLAGRFP